MRLGLLKYTMCIGLGFLLCFGGFGCSTFSQNLESPVVLKPKDWSLGLGSGYAHNINFYEDDEQQREELVPSPFVGGRVGILRNFEAGFTGGSLGLTLGTSADFRMRYMWWGGWKTESQVEELRNEARRKKSKKGKSRRRKKKVADLLDDEDLEGLEESLVLTNGWMSTASLGGFWTGYNNVEEFAVGTHSSGFYFSNSVGYKKRNWLYYFGAKVIHLETDYHFKKDRLTPAYDVDSQFEKLLYGVFAGVTYSWQTGRGHVYQWDTLFSLMQLPRSPDDRSLGYFPGVTLSFWYID